MRPDILLSHNGFTWQNNNENNNNGVLGARQEASTINGVKHTGGKNLMSDEIQVDSTLRKAADTHAY